MTTENPTCACGGPKLIFACSGAADVGDVNDHAASVKVYAVKPRR
jgi:uncharacterized metal-binding protein